MLKMRDFSRAFIPLGIFGFISAGVIPAAAQSAPAPASPRPAARQASPSSAPARRLPPPVESPSQIKVPPLRPFDPPQPKRIELENGAVLFLMEDHELPTIDGFIRIRGGSRDEPAAKTGLVSLYGQVWRTGGATSRTGDQLDDYLEVRAAKVETSGGLDSTTMGWGALKQDFDDVLNVVMELLREPAFREQKLALAKDQARAVIARRNDNPGSIAAREALKLGYGANSPYARQAEYWTIAAVTREDLLAWHKQSVTAANMIIGVTGDFDSAAMEAKLRKTFGSLPKGERYQRPKESFPEPRPGVYFIAKEDVNQSNIRMVHQGIRRDNPDYFAVEVMNEVLGGGFSGRLLNNIRTKAGLAYSVGGGVGASFERPGLFQVVMGTKSESTAAAIQALYKELHDLKTNPATPAELKRAKDAILNSFVFNFDSPEEIMLETMAYEYYGYPLDFLERYRQGIEKTTIEDVARVARKYVDRDKVALLVVGKAGDFDKPLSTFGDVQDIDITILEKPPF